MTRLGQDYISKYITVKWSKCLYKGSWIPQDNFRYFTFFLLLWKPGSQSFSDPWLAVEPVCCCGSFFHSNTKPERSFFLARDMWWNKKYYQYMGTYYTNDFRSNSLFHRYLILQHWYRFPHNLKDNYFK